MTIYEHRNSTNISAPGWSFNLTLFPYPHFRRVEHNGGNKKLPFPIVFAISKKSEI